MNVERIHCCSFTFGETCTSFASYAIHFFEHEHAFHIVLRTLLFNFFAGFPALVGLSGLEPPTSRLSGVRSNRLSYKPISWIRGGCPAPCTLILLDILLSWWRWTGSNRWPPACKAGALPAELHPHIQLNIGHLSSVVLPFLFPVESSFPFSSQFFMKRKWSLVTQTSNAHTLYAPIGPSKLNNTNNSNFVIPDLGC